MNWFSQFKATLTTAALVFGTLQGVGACQICFPYPMRSATDYLLDAEAVVLAREDPQRPFHFSVVEILEGEPGEEAIDLFLNSRSRRSLASDAGRSALLAKMAGKDEAGWRRVAMVDSESGPLVREILRSAATWEKEPRLRVEYFGKLLGHDNPVINRMAHIEVARAPYSEIRRMNGVLSRDEIHAFLDDFRYTEWHALYILLLAQSDDPRNREFIGESFRSAARFGLSGRLAAWATALVELDGVGAVDLIEEEYFRNRDRSSDELKEVVKALSVHGTGGHAHLRDRIVSSYETLLAVHPTMTVLVAADLVSWKRTELTGEISRYVEENPREFDLTTTLQLRAYSRQSK